MARPASPTVRRQLIERAASMVARREQVTLRSLVEGTGVSTMAVYTHFDGMDGLWRAVRQEGFARLAHRLSALEPTDDPVSDLLAASAAYTDNALANPDLYRLMFDATFDLDDPGQADAGFAVLIHAAERARAAGRFDERTDPLALATRLWAFGHGLLSLVLTGVLPAAVVDEHTPPLAEALCIAAGDDPEAARASIAAGWGTRSAG